MNELPPLSDYLRGLTEAAEVEIDLSKPLKLYIRSTELVFKQACIYCNEGDIEKGFILHMKLSNLVLQRLPKHPEYARADFATQKTNLRKLCLRSLDQLERLRPQLEKQFTEAVELQKSALRIAAEEQRRLQDEYARRKTLSMLYDKKHSSGNLSGKSGDDVNDNARHSSMSIGQMAPLAMSSVLPAATVSSYSLPPVHPPTISLHPHEANDSLKRLTDRLAPVNQNAPVEHVPPVSINKSVPRYFSEGGEALRPVHVPSCIVERFLQLAAHNTQRNLETCGVLAGKLQRDEFTITTLIIPKQTATSDTCAMINEEEIVEAQDSRDILSLGWIHTHPTQKCFLSSVDLHTHMPFQLLMSESIAIVCAPTQSPNFGIYRLTDPPGLGIITKCRVPAPFHPHPQNVPIYRELVGPEAHAQLTPNLPLDVVDLRNK